MCDKNNGILTRSQRLSCISVALWTGGSEQWLSDSLHIPPICKSEVLSTPFKIKPFTTFSTRTNQNLTDHLLILHFDNPCLALWKIIKNLLIKQKTFGCVSKKSVCNKGNPVPYLIVWASSILSLNTDIGHPQARSSLGSMLSNMQTSQGLKSTVGKGQSHAKHSWATRQQEIGSCLPSFPPPTKDDCCDRAGPA